MKLTVPKGSTSGKVLRLKGRGFHRKEGGRGDQLVTLAIDIPADDAELAAFVERWNGAASATRARGWASSRLVQEVSPETPEERAKRAGSARAL